MQMILPLVSRIPKRVGVMVESECFEKIYNKNFAAGVAPASNSDLGKTGGLEGVPVG